jgi:hypothetical protein
MAYIRKECTGCDGRGVIFVQDIIRNAVTVKCPYCGGTGLMLVWEDVEILPDGAYGSEEVDDEYRQMA